MNEFERAPEQPYGIEVAECDGIYLKQYIVPKRDTWIPQHAHVWDHLTMLVKGGMFVWRDGALDRGYIAPAAIMIPAGVKHLFRTSADDTEFWCCHNLHGEQVVKVLEEHQLVAE